MPFNLSWIFFAFCPSLFFSQCPFSSHTHTHTHTHRLCLKICNCTSYCSQKFPSHCYPSIQFTRQTQGMCATHPINRPFPLRFVHADLQFKTGTLRFIFTHKQLPHYAATLQRHVQWPVNCVCTAKSYGSGARLILCKPFNWIPLWRKPMSPFCTCSSTRHITHLSVHP